VWGERRPADALKTSLVNARDSILKNKWHQKTLLMADKLEANKNMKHTAHEELETVFNEYPDTQNAAVDAVVNVAQATELGKKWYTALCAAHNAAMQKLYAMRFTRRSNWQLRAEQIQIKFPGVSPTIMSKAQAKYMETWGESQSAQDAAQKAAVNIVLRAEQAQKAALQPVKEAINRVVWDDVARERIMGAVRREFDAMFDEAPATRKAALDAIWNVTGDIVWLEVRKNFRATRTIMNAAREEYRRVLKTDPTALEAAQDAVRHKVLELQKAQDNAWQILERRIQENHPDAFQPIINAAWENFEQTFKTDPAARNAVFDAVLAKTQELLRVRDDAWQVLEEKIRENFPNVSQGTIDYAQKEYAKTWRAGQIVQDDAQKNALNIVRGATPERADAYAAIRNIVDTGSSAFNVHIAEAAGDKLDEMWSEDQVSQADALDAALHKAQELLRARDDAWQALAEKIRENFPNVSQGTIDYAQKEYAESWKAGQIAQDDAQKNALGIIRGATPERRDAYETIKETVNTILELSDESEDAERRYIDAERRYIDAKRRHIMEAAWDELDEMWERDPVNALKVAQAQAIVRTWKLTKRMLQSQGFEPRIIDAAQDEFNNVLIKNPDALGIALRVAEDVIQASVPAPREQSPEPQREDSGPMGIGRTGFGFGRIGTPVPATQEQISQVRQEIVDAVQRAYGLDESERNNVQAAALARFNTELEKYPRATLVAVGEIKQKALDREVMRGRVQRRIQLKYADRLDESERNGTRAAWTEFDRIWDNEPNLTWDAWDRVWGNVSGVLDREIAQHRGAGAGAGAIEEAEAREAAAAEAKAIAEARARAEARGVVVVERVPESAIRVPATPEQIQRIRQEIVNDVQAVWMDADVRDNIQAAALARFDAELREYPMATLAEVQEIKQKAVNREIMRARVQQRIQQQYADRLDENVQAAALAEFDRIWDNEPNVTLDRVWGSVSGVLDREIEQRRGAGAREEAEAREAAEARAIAEAAEAKVIAEAKAIAEAGAGAGVVAIVPARPQGRNMFELALNLTKNSLRFIGNHKHIFLAACLLTTGASLLFPTLKVLIVMDKVLRAISICNTIIYIAGRCPAIWGWAKEHPYKFAAIVIATTTVAIIAGVYVIKSNTPIQTPDAETPVSTSTPDAETLTEVLPPIEDSVLPGGFDVDTSWGIPQSTPGIRTEVPPPIEDSVLPGGFDVEVSW
jgi:hypothetical protein